MNREIRALSFVGFLAALLVGISPALMGVVKGGPFPNGETGAKVLLQESVASGDAAIEMIYEGWTDIYDRVELEFISLAPDNDLGRLQIKPIDNGTPTSASMEMYTITFTDTDGLNGAVAGSWLMPNATYQRVGTGSSDALVGTIFFYKQATRLNGIGHFVWRNEQPSPDTVQVQASYIRTLSATRWDGFEVSFDDGAACCTIASGTIRFWGHTNQ